MERDTNCEDKRKGSCYQQDYKHDPTYQNICEGVIHLHTENRNSVVVSLKHSRGDLFTDLLRIFSEFRSVLF